MAYHYNYLLGSEPFANESSVGRIKELLVLFQLVVQLQHYNHHRFAGSLNLIG